MSDKKRGWIMDMDAILKYIDKELSKGFSPQRIAESLLEAGYEKKFVIDAFSSYQAAHEPDSSQETEDSVFEAAVKKVMSADNAKIPYIISSAAIILLLLGFFILSQCGDGGEITIPEDDEDGNKTADDLLSSGLQKQTSGEDIIMQRYLEQQKKRYEEENRQLLEIRADPAAVATRYIEKCQSTMPSVDLECIAAATGDIGICPGDDDLPIDGICRLGVVTVKALKAGDSSICLAGDLMGSEILTQICMAAVEMDEQRCENIADKRFNDACKAAAGAGTKTCSDDQECIYWSVSLASVRSGDLSACDTLESNIQKDKCRAFSSGDQRYCTGIFTRCTDDSWKALARIAKDPLLCDNVVDVTKRNLCKSAAIR